MFLNIRIVPGALSSKTPVKMKYLHTEWIRKLGPIRTAMKILITQLLTVAFAATEISEIPPEWRQASRGQIVYRGDNLLPHGWNYHELESWEILEIMRSNEYEMPYIMGLYRPYCEEEESRTISPGQTVVDIMKKRFHEYISQSGSCLISRANSDEESGTGDACFKKGKIIKGKSKIDKDRFLYEIEVQDADSPWIITNENIHEFSFDFSSNKNMLIYYYNDAMGISDKLPKANAILNGFLNDQQRNITNDIPATIKDIFPKLHQVCSARGIKIRFHSSHKERFGKQEIDKLAIRADACELSQALYSLEEVLWKEIELYSPELCRKISIKEIVFATRTSSPGVEGKTVDIRGKHCRNENDDSTIVLGIDSGYYAIKDLARTFHHEWYHAFDEAFFEHRGDPRNDGEIAKKNVDNFKYALDDEAETRQDLRSGTVTPYGGQDVLEDKSETWSCGIVYCEDLAKVDEEFPYEHPPDEEEGIKALNDKYETLKGRFKEFHPDPKFKWDEFLVLLKDRETQRNIEIDHYQKAFRKPKSNCTSTPIQNLENATKKPRVRPKRGNWCRTIGHYLSFGCCGK